MPWSPVITDTQQDYRADGKRQFPSDVADGDLGKAIGQRVLGQTIGVQFAQIDTSGTSGLTPTAALKKANPSVF